MMRVADVKTKEDEGMDVVSFTNYFLLADRLIPFFTAWFINVALWAVFVVFLAGLVAELADRAGLRWPLAWGTMVALAPPIFFPLFLIARKRMELQRLVYNHRGQRFRGRGYIAALIALVIMALLQYSFMPPPADIRPVTKSSRPSISIF